MKIIITGDIHNKFQYLNGLIDDEQPDIIICCGDFGYWPNVSSTNELDIIKPQNSMILWCDGNHENHWALKQRDQDEIVPSVIYMPRGSTYTLSDGRTIMFFGGADSIDKNRRTLGIDWFPDEVITQKDLSNLPDVKVDIFITHTCSLEIKKELPSPFTIYKQNDPSYEALSQLWEIYKPNLWYFGHFHYYIQGYYKDTKWTCLGAVEHNTQWWDWLPNQ
jgi:predicted phosphodiesterase